MKRLQYLKRITALYLSNKLWKNYSKRRPLVKYVGAPQIGNVGDQLLFLAISKNLESVALAPCLPAASIVGTFWGKLFFYVLEVLITGGRKEKATILGGGTLINSRFFLEQLEQCISDKTLLFIYGSGSEDIEQDSSFLERQETQLRKAKAIFVRDEKTKKRLENSNIASRVIGDPVLSLGYSCKNRISSEIRLAINLGNDGRDLLGTQENTVCEIGSLVKYLSRNKKWKYYFISFSHEDDEQYEKFIERIGRNIVEYRRYYQESERILRDMPSYDIVIGQRLHSIVLGSAFSKPCISIAYRQKCIDYMSSIRMERYCRPMNVCSMQWIRSRLSEIEANYENIVESISTEIERYRCLQEDAAKIVIGKIN